MNKKGTMEILDSDIATVEALHDLLMDNHGYKQDFPTLIRSRVLTNKMYAALTGDGSAPTEPASTKSRQEIYDSILGGLGIDETKRRLILIAMDEHKKQGRYFTEDDIRQIQEQAYDEGVRAANGERL